MARPTQDIKGGIDLKVAVAPQMAAALDTLVAATGEAKASHLRRAIARYLIELGLIDAQETPVTLTSLTKPKEHRL